MKIGILGWDYSGIDPDGFQLVDHGRERGHETSYFTLEEVRVRPGAGPRAPHVDLTLGGEPAGAFDAVISRGKLVGPEPLSRMEHLDLLSRYPGLALFDPVDVWMSACSKFRMMQRLSAAGIPVPPVRAVSSTGEVEEAFAEWGTLVLKPVNGYGGRDVLRIADPGADKAAAEELLSREGTVMCQPYYPTEGGEYRVTVAGERTPLSMLKLPGVGTWPCKTLNGASFERLDAPPELLDLAVRATRAMGLTLSGLDILPHGDGYLVLEANPVPGFLGLMGPEQQRAVFDGVYEWVEERTPARTGEEEPACAM